MREFYSRVLDRKVLTSRAQALHNNQDMKQYILNGKNSLGTVDSHIEDYRTKERMEEEGDRHFKVKIGRVTFKYYITEREI